MKQSFFIDSTDGILKVFTTPLPEEPAVKASIYADTIAMSKYEQAISLAKKAAVEVDLEHGQTLHAILGPTIHNVNEYLNREWVHDRIYELLVGEIEIDNRWMQPCVEAKRCIEGKSSPEDRDDWCKNSDGCKLSHFKHFARIIIPKNADIKRFGNPSEGELEHREVEESEDSERFKKPTSDEVVQFALLFQTEAGENPINREVLIEMVGFASMVIDRLYENGDITKPSSKEKSSSK